MVGVPNTINTKQDAQVCVTMALAGELDRTQLKQKLENLFSDEMVWNFKQTVSSTSVAGNNQQIIKEKDMITGQDKYELFELDSNPNPRYIAMGFQNRAELQSLIDQL